MSSIDIRRPHSVGKDTAKQKAEELARDMEKELGIKWKWEGDAIKFDASSGAAKGTSGTVSVDASVVHVAIDLPFLLRAVKGTIESKVNQKLDAVLGKA